MPWWLVWVLLVLAALALLAWVGLRVWRALRALLTELEALGEVLDRLEARMAELDAIAEAEAAAQDASPVLLLTPQERAELRAVRAELKEARNERRRQRYDTAAARWAKITG